MEFDKEAIKNKLRENICKVSFTKSNGTNRVMNCTLNESFIDAENSGSKETTKKKKQNPDVLPVWDVDNEGWRSFRWDSLIDFSSERNL